MKVLVCGSRKCVVQAPIERELRKLPPGTVIIHGAARGVDNIAGYVGKRLGFPIRPYPADWDKYQKAAGAIRNTTMLEEEHPDLDGVYIDRVLAFHEDPGLGKGTRDMVAKAKKANPTIQIEIHLL